MKRIDEELSLVVMDILKNNFDTIVDQDRISISPTRKEFKGDFTLVVFPFTKTLRKKPEEIGQLLGTLLVKQTGYITAYNVVKGFLNLTIDNSYWLEFLNDVAVMSNYGHLPSNGKKVLVEFSSPNTNKPLHLGHIRNILLGWSSSMLLEASGHEVVRTQIVNDRGIAICKSMLAWQKGNHETPESSGIKGDHLIGKYYVAFESMFKAEYTEWQNSEVAKTILNDENPKNLENEAFFKGFKNEYFNRFSKIGKEARLMLIKWEDGDTETIALWKKMNGWVLNGFKETYKKLGVSFNKDYFESDTYILGKDIINEGLASNVFEKDEDGSVWVDLTDIKMDRKIVLRSDGTSVYMTQDLGTADLRYNELNVSAMTYVVADEQNYHFKVLFEILKRLKRPYAKGLHHLSYGMVELPTGKMKSREGTVVDADELIRQVIAEATKGAEERGVLAELPQVEREEILRKIGLGALKYFMIMINPKRKMLFDPKESVAMQGQTGPYIQYAYVRIQGLLRKARQMNINWSKKNIDTIITPTERSLILEIFNYKDIIITAAKEFDPSHLANFCYNLAKTFNRFYHDEPILIGDKNRTMQKLKLSAVVADVIEDGMKILGIEMPEKM